MASVSGLRIACSIFPRTPLGAGMGCGCGGVEGGDGRLSERAGGVMRGVGMGGGGWAWRGETACGGQKLGNDTHCVWSTASLCTHPTTLVSLVSRRATTDRHWRDTRPRAPVWRYAIINLSPLICALCVGTTVSVVGGVRDEKLWQRHHRQGDHRERPGCSGIQCTPQPTATPPNNRSTRGPFPRVDRTSHVPHVFGFSPARARAGVRSARPQAQRR